MKFKRFLSLFCVLGLMCSILSGCVCSVTEINVNADGSGTATAYTGLTKEYYESEGVPAAYLDTLVKYTRYGVEYYGEWENPISFSDVTTVEKLTFDPEDPESDFSLNMFKVTKVGDTFTLEVDLQAMVAAYFENEDVVTYENMTEEEKLLFEVLLSSCIDVVYTFPCEMKQISGHVISGICADGKTITIKMFDVYKELVMGTLTLDMIGNPVFASTASVTPPLFTDVADNAWYYAAVSALAAGGLVNGVGNNKFNPEGTLTYAEFCQILARAMGLETGMDENGYWAGKAINSCIQNGLVLSQGDICSANYNVPITREAAISSMCTTGVKSDESAWNMTLMAEDIPDFDKISPQYQSSILTAYRYGLTSGMDSKRTFNPQGILTRAQICQLFFNLNWFSPR